MSLILDALKKSEQQRQREKAPGLQSIHQPLPVATKKTVRPWWWLVGLLIVGNTAFMGYWLWREQNVRAPMISEVSGTDARQVPAPVPTNPPSQSETLRQPQLHAANQNAASPDGQPEFTTISPRQASPSVTGQRVEAPAAATQRIEEISELPAAVRNDLPAMTFSFHVYSENPDERTIIINDRRIREGDAISPGLILQSITKDGVILLFEQHRIHVAVLSDW